MRVLGIDPGSRHLGWGVLERTGTRIAHVAHGVVDAVEAGALAERLVAIDDALVQVIDEQRPDVAAVESLFFAKDAQSAAKLGHARGVVLLRLARSRVPIHEYPPALVKRSVAGRGAADKRQITALVTAILKLGAPPREDAADALAVALTHLSTAGFADALAKAKSAARSR